jgi:hypothetical protein
MKFVIACGKKSYNSHPGSSLNSNWVALLKKASPVPTPINSEEDKGFQSLKIQKNYLKANYLNNEITTFAFAKANVNFFITSFINNGK